VLPLQTENQRVYGGYGENQQCDGCGLRINASDVLYEVEVGSSSLLALHRQCFDAWLTESRAVSGAGSAGSVVVSDRSYVLLR
jgi:hypothetical protein